MAPRYYALTTTNAQQSGWTPLRASGPDGAAVEMDARAIIGPIATEYGTDIYLDTEHKNLVIVPSSKLRFYGWTEAALLAHLDTLEEMHGQPDGGGW